MLERARMILKRRGEVGLGGVARVIGLRRQAEVRDAEIADEVPLPEGVRSRVPAAETGVGDHEEEQQDLNPEDRQKSFGPPHRISRGR